MHKGLSSRGNSFLFRFGRIWAQNPSQLLRKLPIVFTLNVRVGSKRLRRLAVPDALHPNLQWHTKPVHKRDVRVTECM
jgi:hypothetical protein